MRRWVGLALGCLLLAACGVEQPTPEKGAWSPSAATSPAGTDVSQVSGPLQTFLEHARLYRGNPAVLGVVTGLLLLVALGFGIVTVARARRGAGAPR